MKNKVMCIFAIMLLLIAGAASTAYAAKKPKYKAVAIGMKDEDGFDRQKKWWCTNWDASNSMSLLTHGYPGTTTWVSNCNSKTGLEYLKSTSFFFIRTHGLKDKIKFTDSKTLISHITISDISKANLSNLQLAVYGTCKAGQGGINANNIVNRTYKSGAKHVVGFKDTVHPNQMNTFFAQFIHELGTDKETVGDAYDNALFWVKVKHFGNAGGVNNVLIRGNKNVKLRK